MTDDYRSERPFGAGNRPLWGLGCRWLFVGVAAFVALAILVIVLGFVLNWFSAGVAVVSPQNVKQQYSDAYGRFADLKATACNVKQERTLVASAPAGSDVQVQYQQQETAYEQNYRRIQAQYDAAYANAFAAKHVGPSDLPRTAPELEANIAASC